MTTLDDLRAALDPEWLRETEQADPATVTRLFARAGRKLGHEPLPGVPGWTAGQAGRAVLLGRLSPDEITTLYHQGDANERLAVLKALPLLAIGDAAVPLLHDALRTNDARLVAAALGPYAEHLDADTWRQGVVKCVFMGVPLGVVDRLDDRADAELAFILGGLAEERTAAGRTIPDDAAALLDRLAKRKGN
jgi:hypothetical protein